MRRLFFVGTLLAMASVVAMPVAARDGAAAEEERFYLVLYSHDASLAAGRTAIREAGGAIRNLNRTIGLAEVVSANPNFLDDVRAEAAIARASRDVSIGATRPGLAPRFADERLHNERLAARPHSGGPRIKPAPGTDPLTGYQWDMRMINAQNDDGSLALEQRGAGVLIGVMDTGIDGLHDDIAPNFSNALSRNFTVDIPAVDGECEYADCVDPANVDDNSHGTHVAGTIASPENGIGITGVAPEATLVNLRAGQDSGFFFLGPTVDALTYAADNGIDVVNMSFFVDPWLYNCPDASGYVSAPEGKPTAEELAQQRLIYDAMHEALAYAHGANVTLIAAAGNSAFDLDAATRHDAGSPNYPPDMAYERTVTDECLDLPTEAPNVMSISAVGPSGIKADYSNYGASEITVAAPGGYFRDFFGTKLFRSPLNEVWAPYPENVARAFGEVTKGGGVRSPFVLRDCSKELGCSYYQGIQGTSMAAPHATGVAALVIGALGGDADPGVVRNIIENSAADHACPVPATVDYTIVGRPASWNATCTGTPDFNNFYGHGLVDAAAAVALAESLAP
jgi:subtilisin family serine protease